jgi:hypothetical protein
MFFAVKLKSGEENHHLIIDAHSYTEAETMAHQIAEVICSSSFELPLIVKTPFKEILESATMSKPEEGKFFKGKIAIKEETAAGKVKLVRNSILVKAEDINDAFSELKAYCKGFVSDVDVIAVEASDITENYDKKAVEELISTAIEV